MDNNNLILLDYIKSYGFKPNEYYGILELFQPVKYSISQYLGEYNQFLLSKFVTYRELDSVGINGAYGYLDNNGDILVPKTLENDERFLNNMVLSLYKRHSYDIPTINDFETIIGRIPFNLDNETYQQLIISLLNNREHNQYFSFCIDGDKTDYTGKILLYSNIVEQINNMLGKKLYTFEHDTSQGKELCLIKRDK